jgi:hypothetical protein
MMQRVVVAGVILAALATRVAADRIAEPPTPAVLAGDPIAVAVLIEGPLLSLADDEPMFAALQLALDTIADMAPRGSMGALLVYFGDVQAVREIGPLATMRGDVLGVPSDYEDKLGRNLVGGMTRALNELEQVRSARKALIVLGDGADNQLDRAPGAMRELRDRAARDGIDVYALVHDIGIGDRMTALRHLPQAHVRDVKTYLELVPAFEATLREIVAAPPRVPAGDREPREPASAAASAGTSRTLAWSLLAAGVALGALGAFVLVRRRAATADRAS